MVGRWERVVVLHHRDFPVDALYDTLRTCHTVRSAFSAAEAADIASSVAVACVVCIAGGSVGVRETVEKLRPTTSPIVFLRSAHASADDDLFLLTNRLSWLSWPIDPQEVVAAVSALSAGHRPSGTRRV